MLLAAAINWHSVFFLLFGALTCLAALGVLFSSNIVRMAFYLIISLGATAGLFFLAGAHFVGAMQIMIYVGGTLVLLIFGVMRNMSAFTDTGRSPATWRAAAYGQEGTLRQQKVQDSVDGIRRPAVTIGVPFQLEVIAG